MQYEYRKITKGGSKHDQWMDVKGRKIDDTDPRKMSEPLYWKWGRTISMGCSSDIQP